MSYTPDILDDGQATKTMLGFGELFRIHQGGIITPSESDSEKFDILEVQDGTTINSLTFTFDNTDYGSVVVDKYNCTVSGVLLIPPVYRQLTGTWSEINTTGGQVNCYGKRPIG